MESHEETAAAIVALLFIKKKNKKKRKRSAWVTPRLRRRINLGLHETLAQELRFEDKSDYKKLTRTTPQDFDEILGFSQDDITVLTVPVTLNCSTNFYLLFTFL